MYLEAMMERQDMVIFTNAKLDLDLINGVKSLEMVLNP
jgi:hypothetical protein